MMRLLGHVRAGSRFPDALLAERPVPLLCGSTAFYGRTDFKRSPASLMVHFCSSQVLREMTQSNIPDSS